MVRPLPGAGRNIKAGTYQVDMALNPMELLDKLEAGELRARPASPSRRAGTAGRSPIAWWRSPRRTGLTSFGGSRRRIWGAALPDTYFLRPDADAAEVLKQLTRRFDQVFADVIAGHRDAAKLAKPGPERRRLIIMASLVEKEATTSAIAAWWRGCSTTGSKRA
ncbi:MAG: endolytic transglycosylase MltG [bacterium]